MKKTMCIILLVLCSFCLSARDRHVTTSESGRLAEDLLEAGLYENREYDNPPKIAGRHT